MKNVFKAMYKALKHIETLHNIFSRKSNFSTDEELDFLLYKHNSDELTKSLSELNFSSQLYAAKGRQMILSDFYEYIFLGRGYYALKTRTDKAKFIRVILHFVNLLMSYEGLTVSDNLRRAALNKLEKQIKGNEGEELFSDLERHTGSIAIGRGKSSASKKLEKYFDSLLPKTAGGLWHELLVYIFLLRNNCGYIIPHLLTQRWISLDGHIIPPDFLILTHNQRLYGIEVGTTKETQSGTFSLQTAIPTATVNTNRSRTSDRCPICNKWIQFCPYVIENYANLNHVIEQTTVYCMDKCTVYTKEDIAKGKCPHTKYSRPKAETLRFANHIYANGYHYHYKCVLDNVSEEIRDSIIQVMNNGRDSKALKTHFPYYEGLEALIKHSGQVINETAQIAEKDNDDTEMERNAYEE